jgi:MFS family permease
MIATLRQRNFTLLWIGQLVSLIGDWALGVGLPIYVFLLTHSVLILSIALLAGRLPSILLGSVAGVFVDRWDRRRTMIVTNLLLAVALLPLLLVRTADLVWIVYAVAFVTSSIEQFFVPAENALLPHLVGEEHLVAANSLNALSSNLARLVGPALGGVIAAVFGLDGIVLVDAASFVIAGLFIGFIVVPLKATVASDTSLAAAEAGAISRVWREWVDGLRVIVHERTLVVVLSVLSFTSLGEGVFGVLYPVFVNRVLHGVALAIGELMSAQAVGGLIGGLLVGLAGRRVTSRGVIGGCSVAFGLIDLAIFNTPTFLPSFGLPVFAFQVGLFIAVGGVGIGFSTGIQSLTQARSPDAYRGRIFGALGTTMGVLGLIGTITAGTVTELFGVITVLNIQGAGYVLAGLLLIAFLPRGPHGKQRITASAAPFAVRQTPVSPAE